MKKGFLMMVVAAAGLALPAAAEAQFGGRVSVMPYVGYGFFGDLPNSSTSLEADMALGARVGYRLAPQWGVFGSFQRSTPEVTGSGFDLDVDHWSVGGEFSYVPRGGAEGMLPILLEAGLGQTRYDGGSSDFAVNIGIASALRLSDAFAIRYGANDFISNYRNGDGVVNHIFVQVGAELTF